MNDITFMNEFIRKAKPKSRLRYALKEEGRLLIEMDRAEELASTAHERKREESETNKLVAALLKEKHDAFVTKKRHQQLLQNTDELRGLRHYIATAETAKDLIDQLKLQEEKIKRRFEDAKNYAVELRGEYRAAEERQRKIEEQKRLEGKMLRDDLVAQMAVNEMRRNEEFEENIKDGQELRDKLNKLDVEDRKKQEAALREKIEMRKEVLENLRIRQELKKIQNANDTSSMQAQYREQRRLDELNQRIKHYRHWGIQRKGVISAMVGEKTLEIENKKRQTVTNLIDMFISERQAKEEQAYQNEIEKQNENRRMLQNEDSLHLERKRAEKERQLRMNMEVAQHRKPLKREEQDRPRGKLRSQSQILATQKFMAEKLEIDKERFRREAEERRQQLESLAKQAQLRENEIEATKIAILNQKPIQLLRYLPSSVVRTDYLPQPLREKVREEVLKEPIPMLSKKRHQPHLRGHQNNDPQQVKCSKTCYYPHVILNIF